MSKQRDEAIPSRDVSINTLSAPCSRHKLPDLELSMPEHAHHNTRRWRSYRTAIPPFVLSFPPPLFRVNSFDAPRPHVLPLHSRVVIPSIEFNNYKATWQSGLMR